MSDQQQYIPPDSLPDHDGWGWDSFWSCTDWVGWHKSMLKKYGKDYADSKWVGEYDTSSYGAHEINCATSSVEFETYVKENGLANKSYILSKVYKAQKAIDTVTSPVKNTFETIANTTTVLKYVLPLTLAVMLIMIAHSYTTKLQAT